MPEIDKRNTVEHLHVGGSDIGLQVKLLPATAIASYGAGAVAGWYTIGTFDGGTIAYTPEVEEDRDENGQLTGKTIEAPTDFLLNNVLKETSDAVEDLIDDYLSKSFHAYRYALPAGTITVDVAGTPTVVPAHKVYGIGRGKVKPGFSYETKAGVKRMRPFELRGSKYGATPAFVRQTVSLAHETLWPAKLAAFKTTA